MIRLEVAYTENAGRFYRGHLTVNGENIETFNWLHEVNEYLTELVENDLIKRKMLKKSDRKKSSNKRNSTKG